MCNPLPLHNIRDDYPKIVLHPTFPFHAILYALSVIAMVGLMISIGLDTWNYTEFYTCPGKAMYMIGSGFLTTLFFMSTSSCIMKYICDVPIKNNYESHNEEAEKITNH